jgi:hypothetical protein
VNRFNKHKEKFGIIVMLLVTSAVLIHFDFKKFRKISSVYVIDCTIFDSKMIPLINFSANICVFLKNGELVKYVESNGETDITLVDVNGLPRWKKSYIAHHTMKVSRDEKRLYFLSMEKKVYRGSQAKFDKVIALDLATGDMVATWNVFDIKDQLESEFGRPLLIRKGTPYNQQNNQMGEIIDEFTHFNSINVIPKSIDDFPNEEIIVNSGRGFELFFTRDLKLTRKFWVDYYWGVNTHDAQITKDGNLLIYKNWNNDTQSSSLEKISLKTHEVLWKYDHNSLGSLFKSHKFGSIQLFDDSDFLYSDMEKGGRFTIVNSRGRVMNEYFHPDIDRRNNLPQSFHTVRQVKYEDLSDGVQDLLENDLKVFMLKDFYQLYLKI